MNVLFVSPHPDDVEFACFGTLLKHMDNKDRLFYLSVSECSNLKRNRMLPQEVRSIMAIIKPRREIRLDLPNTRVFDTESREILRASLENLRDKEKIDVVYSPWVQDINQDHRATAEEVIRVFRYKTIIQYEITHSCPGFTPNYYVEISEKQMKRKIDIIKIFKSQASKSYASPKWIESVMYFRGLEAGVRYAEAFMSWRIIQGID